MSMREINGSTVAKARVMGNMTVLHGKSPIVQNGVWYEYDDKKREYVSTGVPARGPEGERGPQGERGPEGTVDYTIINELSDRQQRTEATANDIKKDLGEFKEATNTAIEGLDNQKADRSELPNLEPYALKTDIPQPYDDTALRAEIAEKADSADLEQKADKTELDEQKRSLDFLWKVNKGQTWDIEQREEEGRAQLPSGGEYGNIDEVRGKTEQESTNGFNIIEIRNVSQQTSAVKLTERGITFIPHTETSIFKTVIPTFSEGLTYTYSFYAWSDSDGTEITADLQPDASQSGENDLGKDVRYTLTKKRTKYTNTGIINEGATDLRFFRLASFAHATDSNVYIEDIMLEEGSVAHDYEPFTNGASPNPQYPQSIESVEEIRICKSNNLFNPLEYYTREKFKASESSAVWWLPIYLKNGVYAVSTNVYASSDTAAVFATTKRGESPSTGMNGILKDTRTINVSNGVLYIGAYGVTNQGTPHANASKTIDLETYIRTGVEIIIQPVGTDIKHADVEYRRTVPPRPLNKIGWYVDACDVVSGEWVWNTASTNMRDLRWQYYGKWGEHQLHYTDDLLNIIGYADPYKIYAVSDSYKSYTNNGHNGTGSYDQMPNYGMRTRNSDGRTYVSNDDYNNSADFMAALGDAKMTYALLKPTTEPISPDDLEWLRNLTLNEGESLFVTDNRGRDVSYLMSDFINLGKVVTA